MLNTTPTFPGFHGRGADHGQSWRQDRLPDARRVRGIARAMPILARGVGAVRREIDKSAHAVWIIAHSFGCQHRRTNPRRRLRSSNIVP